MSIPKFTRRRGDIICSDEDVTAMPGGALYDKQGRLIKPPDPPGAPVIVPQDPDLNADFTPREGDDPLVRPFVVSREEVERVRREVARREKAAASP